MRVNVSVCHKKCTQHKARRQPRRNASNIKYTKIYNLNPFK